MEYNGNLELTARDREFLNKFQDVIENCEGVSYYGIISAFWSLTYRIHKAVCLTKMVSSGSGDGILELIDDIEKDLVSVCGIVTKGVKEETAQLLDENA